LLPFPFTDLISEDLIIGKIVELEEVYLKEVDGKLNIIFSL